MVNDKSKYSRYYLRNKVEIIHRTCVFEGLATTRLETSTVIESGKCTGVCYEDTQIILNIYNVWQKMMREEFTGTTKEVVIQLNRDLKSSMEDSNLTGKVRTQNIKISGTTYRPPSYKQHDLEGLLDNVLGIINTNNVDSVLYVYLHLMRTQFFVDGNKRTAYLFVNWVLLVNDMGYMLYLPSEVSEKEYLKKLKGFYERPKESEKGMIKYLKQYYLKKV